MGPVKRNLIAAHLAVAAAMDALQDAADDRALPDGDELARRRARHLDGLLRSLHRGCWNARRLVDELDATPSAAPGEGVRRAGGQR